MTPQSIITKARDILNDTDAAGYRQSDDELLRYVNAGMLELSVQRPDLFQTVGHIECEADAVEQAVTFADAQKLLDVIGIHGGRALTPFDLKSMQAFNPGWKTDAAGPARQWSGHPGDQLRFYIHPKAPAAQLIDVLFVKNPTVLALTDTITEAPEGLEPALVDYVVYRAESKDDEHVLTQRAAASYSAFLTKIGAINGAAQ